MAEGVSTVGSTLCPGRGEMTARRAANAQRDYSKLNAQRSTSRRSAGTIGKSRHDGGRRS
jgi:hypothetical protein